MNFSEQRSSSSSSRRGDWDQLPILRSRCVAAAQQPLSLPGVPAHMVVTVETRHGAQMPVIDKADVMVFEGRDRDTVTDWVAAQGDRAGLDLFILLGDASALSLGTQLEDIRQFINAQPPNTRIGIACMQNGIARIVQDLTSDHALASKALRLEFLA